MIGLDSPNDNPYAAPEAPINLALSGNTELLTPRIAALPWRILAFFADYLVLFTALYGLRCVLMLLGGYGMPRPLGRNTPPSAWGLATALFGLLAWSGYFGIQESSQRQATLGKRLFRLRVVRLKGARISFGLRPSAPS